MQQDEDPFAPPADISLRELDRVAHRVETAWGSAERLCRAAGAELATKFDAQLQRLHTAQDGNDDAKISAAAGGMRRAWLSLDAAARATGQLPPGEAVFVGMHPGYDGSEPFKVALYQPGVSLADLDADCVRVHVDQAIRYIPAIVLQTFAAFGQPTAKGHRVRDLPPGGDEIPF